MVGRQNFHVRDMLMEAFLSFKRTIRNYQEEICLYYSFFNDRNSIAEKSTEFVINQT